jgi:hypothetical protein
LLQRFHDPIPAKNGHWAFRSARCLAQLADIALAKLDDQRLTCVDAKVGRLRRTAATATRCASLFFGHVFSPFPSFEYGFIHIAQKVH